MANGSRIFIVNIIIRFRAEAKFNGNLLVHECKSNQCRSNNNKKEEKRNQSSHILLASVFRLVWTECRTHANADIETFSISQRIRYETTLHEAVLNSILLFIKYAGNIWLFSRSFISNSAQSYGPEYIIYTLLIKSESVIVTAPKIDMTLITNESMCRCCCNTYGGLIGGFSSLKTLPTTASIVYMVVENHIQIIAFLCFWFDENGTPAVPAMMLYEAKQINVIMAKNNN